MEKKWKTDSEIINVRNLYLNTSTETRWFVNYILIYADGSETKARKETGFARYKIALQQEPDLNKRKVLANRLITLIGKDIENGIDPQYRNEIIDERNRQKLIEAQKEDDEKISFDKALDWLKRDKGWVNPTSEKESSASTIPAMLTSSFKPFLADIGKEDDIRAVTRLDVNNFIEKHFNAPKGGNIPRWKSSTCKAARARVSILYNSLINRFLIDFNPTFLVKVKSDSEKIEQDDLIDFDRFEPWSNEEVDVWFNGFKGDVEFPKRITEDVTKLIETVSYIIHYAYIRKKEMLRLRMWMIDLDKGYFRIPPSITKSAEKIKSKALINLKIHKKLKPVLQSWIEHKFPNGYEKDDFLFYKTKPQVQYKYPTLSDNFGKIREVYKDKYPKLFSITNQYALKHTGVIKYFNALVTTRETPANIMKKIQKLCRHATFTQTETYLRDLNLVFEEHDEELDF